MYSAGNNRWTQAERNKKSYASYTLNDKGGQTGINNARINITKRFQSKEHKLDMAYIQALYQMYYNDRVIRRTEKLVTDNLFQERPVFSINDRELQLTREFRTIADNEYARFSKDAHVAYRCIGLIPWHYVILASGYIVPRVLQPETFTLSVYQDYFAETQCYKVYRNVDGEMQEFATQIVDSSNSNSTLNGEHHAVLNALHGRDPRESASMRIDLGTKFPGENEVDTTIFIYDAFPTRPSCTGVLRSDMHAIYLMYNEMMTIKRLYYESLRSNMQQTPYVQSEAMNEEAVNGDIGVTLYNKAPEMIEMRAQDRFATQEVAMNVVNELQRRERIDRVIEHMQDYNLDDASYERSMDPRFDVETREQIRRYDATAPIFDTSNKTRKYGTALLPGEKLASYSHAQTNFAHLPILLQDYRTEVANILGAPPVMFELNRANQDQTALFLRNFFKTRHALVTMHGNLITTVYNRIYSPKDNSYMAENYFDLHMRAEVMRSIARDYKLYYTQIKKYEPRLFRLLQREAPAIQDTVLTHLERKHGESITRDKNWFNSIEGAGGSSASKSKSKRKDAADTNRVLRSERVVPYDELLKPGEMLATDSTTNAEERAWDRSYREPQLVEQFRGASDVAAKAVKDPVGALQDMQNQGADSIENGLRALKAVQDVEDAHAKEREYEDALINEEIRALMFLGTLQSLSTDTIFTLYSLGGNKQRMHLQKMYENFNELESNAHVTISFTSAANISLEDLLKRVTLGIISKKEAVDIVRTQMFMSRDAEEWDGTEMMDLVINAMRDALVDETLASLGVGKKRSAAASASSDSSSPTASSNSAAKPAANDGKRRKREEMSKTSSSVADTATVRGQTTSKMQSNEKRAANSTN